MELNKLIEQFNTQDWELQLSAADTIAELNLEDGNIFLINQLK